MGRPRTAFDTVTSVTLPYEQPYTLGNRLPRYIFELLKVFERVHFTPHPFVMPPLAKHVVLYEQHIRFSGPKGFWFRRHEAKNFVVISPDRITEVG
ncbi:MAG: hypothetical protein ACHQ50_17515 [Fimbriimonadales bacterium]